MFRIIHVFSLLTSLTCCASPVRLEPKPNVIALFQKEWDKIKTFRADFTQSVYSKQLGLPPDDTEGALYLIRPDKLRWETKADGSFQILKGRELTIVRPNARRGNSSVEVYKDVNLIADTRLLKFLTGGAKFDSVYKIAILSETPEKAELKFVPKRGQKDSPPDTYIAEIDKNGYLLVSLTTETADSKVVVKFRDIKTNPEAVEETLFTYTPKEKDTVTRK